MPRAALSEDEFLRFRAELCEAATKRFAEYGYAGVTMRGLASDLGCSPMTPYRYFENKAEIFAAVRALAFERFADALAAVADPQADPARQLEDLGRTYCRFAVDEPQAYRIMFELDPGDVGGPEPESARSWYIMRETVERGVASGAFRGDADVLAHVFWCAVHGLVTLHLAGKLVLGKTLEDLIGPCIEATLSGARAQS